MGTSGRILVVGSSGFLGTAVMEHFLRRSLPIEAVDRRVVDLRRFDAHPLEALLDGRKYEYVVICAAVTDIEVCFRDRSLSDSVNVMGTIRLLDTLKVRNITPVFFSSDYVFSGGTEPYRENATRRPTTVYGNQKVAVEKYLEENFERFLIFRTSKLISKSRHLKNIILPVVENLRLSNEVRCFEDQWLNPVFVEDIARVLELAFQKELNGVFHLGTRRIFTRLELAHALANWLGFNRDVIRPIRLSDIKFSEPRPTHNLLNCEKIEKALNFRFCEIEDAIPELAI